MSRLNAAGLFQLPTNSCEINVCQLDDSSNIAHYLRNINADWHLSFARSHSRCVEFCKINKTHPLSLRYRSGEHKSSHGKLSLSHSLCYTLHIVSPSQVWWQSNDESWLMVRINFGVSKLFWSIASAAGVIHQIHVHVCVSIKIKWP